MNTVEAIKARRSVRTFRDEKLSLETEEFIEKYIRENTGRKGPLGHTINMLKVEISPNVKLGTYGIIKNPKAFIAGTCENVDNGIIDFGYVFEKMILEFTKHNLGTCWLGGTFKRAVFKENIPMDPQHIVPAVTPIGYYDGKRAFESLMRKAVRADERKKWSDLFFKEDFNTSLTEEEALMFKEPLEMVRIGPSASNKQPWRFVVKEKLNECHLYLEELPRYNNSLHFPIQLLDIGIAMLHFEETCKSIGVEGSWIVEDPGIETPNVNYKYISTFK